MLHMGKITPYCSMLASGMVYGHVAEAISWGKYQLF